MTENVILVIILAQCLFIGCATIIADRLSRNGGIVIMAMIIETIALCLAMCYW